MRRNPIDPVERYAKLARIAQAGSGASEGERQNALAAMRRMEAEYGAEALKPKASEEELKNALVGEILQLSEFSSVQWDERRGDFTFGLSADGQQVGSALTRTLSVRKLQELSRYIDYGDERPLYSALLRASGASSNLRQSYQDLIRAYSMA